MNRQNDLCFYLIKQCDCESGNLYPNRPKMGNTFEINRRFGFVMFRVGSVKNGYKSSIKV